MKRTLSATTIARAFAHFLGEVPAGRHSQALRACARFLQREHRLHDASEILDALDEVLLARHGMRRATVAVAERLSGGETRRIEDALRMILGAPVVARVSEAPYLLAGFRADVGDLRVDASLRGVLSRLRAEMRALSQAKSLVRE